MKTGLDNYDFREKNIWRRQVWNAIKKRLPDKIPPKKSLGIYLPGPDALDADIAVTKGFKKNNLIGIDINNDNILKLRENGLIGINCKVQDLISNWGNEPKFSFANLDLCCGLTSQAFEIIYEIIYSDCFKHQSVLALNFQRGRETNIDFWKKKADYWNGFSEDMIKVVDVSNVIGDIKIHRGFLFFLEFLSFANLKMLEDTGKIILFDTFYDLLDAKFISYHSKNLIMDSVVFTLPAEKLGIFRCLRHKPNKNTAIKQKISAAKAIRTMRLSA